MHLLIMVLFLALVLVPVQEILDARDTAAGRASWKTPMTHR